MLAGSTLHEVAHVVAAGQAVGAEAAASAVVAKMLRVLLLAPFLLWLAHAWRRSGQLSADGAPTPRPPCSLCAKIRAAIAAAQQLVRARK
mgnify:CR=1 FL=1